MKRDISPDLWQRISEKLDGALELPPADRRAYFEAACKGDDNSQRHVESLLLFDQTAEGFLDRPALAGVGLAMEERMDEELLSGERIGPWELARELGRGEWASSCRPLSLT